MTEEYRRSQFLILVGFLTYQDVPHEHWPLLFHLQQHVACTLHFIQNQLSGSKGQLASEDTNCHGRYFECNVDGTCPQSLAASPLLNTTYYLTAFYQQILKQQHKSKAKQMITHRSSSAAARSSVSRRASSLSSLRRSLSSARQSSPSATRFSN